MIRIDLDGIENYKELSTTAHESIKDAKDKMASAATALQDVVLPYHLLSKRNSEYTYDALDVKRNKIVAAINKLAKTFDGLITDLEDIDKDCDSFIDDVEADEGEIMGLLGSYSDSEFREMLADNSRTTNDVTSFRPGDCDYYVNREGITLSMEPWPTQNGDIISLQEDAHVKKLYTVKTAAGDYTAILCEYDGKMVTGFVPSKFLSETYNNFNNGESHSNIEETFDYADGYAISTNGGFRLRRYPTLSDGTESQVINEVPDGTRVKVVGVWQNGEQEAETWYLVSYTKTVTKDGKTRKYNFTGFANAEYLKTTNNNHETYERIEDVLPVVTKTDSPAVILDEPTGSTIPANTELTVIDSNDEAYEVTWNDNGTRKLAWVDKSFVEQRMPESLSNMGDAEGY